MGRPPEHLLPRLRGLSLLNDRSVIGHVPVLRPDWRVAADRAIPHSMVLPARHLRPLVARTAALIGAVARTGALVGVVAAAMAAAPSCSPVQARAKTEFWLEAAPDPQIEVDPPETLPRDATDVVLEGLVVGHGPAFSSVADYTLELLQDQGQTTYLHYSMGAGQRIPLERGQLTRVALYQRRSDDGSVARALLVEAYRPGALIHERQPVGIIQVDGLIARAQLPRPLRQLQLHDEIVYQTAERVRSNCSRAVAHRGFTTELDSALSDPDKHRDVWTPGVKLTLKDAINRYDVLLIDNREVIATDCPDQARRVWFWSAVYVAPPPGTAQLLTDVEPAAKASEGNSVPLPTAATPSTEVKPTKKKPVKLKN